MSVPESERTEGKFDVLVKSHNVSTYTLQVCCNKKIFVEEYKVLTDDLIKTAMDIYIDAFSANEINAKDNSTLATERLTLQHKAIANCSKMLALIQMAHKIFHLDSRRVRYWAGITIEARNLLISWHKTDSNRYGK